MNGFADCLAVHGYAEHVGQRVAGGPEWTGTSGVDTPWALLVGMPLVMLRRTISLCELCAGFTSNSRARTSAF